MINESELNSLESQILAHWRLHLPQKVSRLDSEGRLLDEVREAASKTVDALLELRHRGIPVDRAWEAVQDQHAFLPAEPEDEEPLATPLPE